MSARSDLVTLPGRLLWSVLITPEVPPKGKNKRYQAKFQIAKGSPEFDQLWEVIEDVAIRTWGAQGGNENLKKYKEAIKSGMDPQYSPVSIQDGDLFQPQYNAGFWLIQATRRENQGPPQLRGIDGRPIEDASQVPQGGDGCYFMVNVWAQSQYERMNLCLEAVRKVVPGEPIGGPSREMIAAGVAELEQMKAPLSLPGVKPVGEIPAEASRPSTPVREAVPVQAETATTSAPRRRRLVNLND